MMAKAAVAVIHGFSNWSLGKAPFRKLVQLSENEGLIFVQATSGFAVMVHRNGFAMVALK